MYYPEVMEDNNTRSMIDSWMGYNHNRKIGYGEFYDMENLCSDQYPLLRPRPTRVLLNHYDDPTFKGILYTENNVLTLEDTTLVMPGIHNWDLSEYFDENVSDEQTLLRFGSYVLIFPVGVYVSLEDFDDYGLMESAFESETDSTITYSVCTATGGSYQNLVVSETTPADPEDGDYWLCSLEGSQGMYIYDEGQATWNAVVASYIKIEVPGAHLTDYFAEGDCVKMNTQIPSINDGSVIRAIDDEYIVVSGFLSQVSETHPTTEAWVLKLTRELPMMDYWCCDKNRVWGCRYGLNRQLQMVNEIYCSQLGNFKNWSVYDGLSTDSYAVSVGTPGKWTGAVSYQGYPTFFKENAIFKVFGAYPAEYQVSENNHRGVQDGSAKSLAQVDEYLVYKTANDIVIYDGSSPVSISDNLGKEGMYFDAVGGGCLGKYHVVMANAAGTKFYFIYDMRLNMWEKQSVEDILQFTESINGQLYAITQSDLLGLGSHDNMIYLMQNDDEVAMHSEEWTTWFAETGEMGYEYADYKYVSKLTLRAFVPYRSELCIDISYDDRPWENIGIMRGADNIASQAFSFVPFRCDHYRIRFSGHGDCMIYSLATTLEAGSEEKTYGY